MSPRRSLTVSPSSRESRSTWESRSSHPGVNAAIMTTGEINADDLEGLVGRELDGRYLLDKFVDRGGFGAVYRGIDKKFGHAVAVKVGLSYREFMKEAKLAAEVRHDNIVQVSDYGNDHGLAYLVMEFLHGDDLEKLFKNQGSRLTTDQLRKFVSEVGDALHHAHSDQLIHRDLKPRNIILKTSRSKTGNTSPSARFVLLDFGIAAKLDAQGTQRNRTQDGAGTVEYMAPELLRTSPIATQQSDIYAFGTILYQMMAGRVPFQQCDTSHMALAECLNAIAHSPPPPFSEIAPDRKYPSAAEAIVMECLAKDPARRPQSMSEVRDRFLAALPATQTASPRRQEYSQTLRPGELDDTAPTPEQNAGSWNSGRPMEAPPGPTRWPWIVLSLALLTGLVYGIGRPYFSPATFPVTSSLMSVNGTEFSAVDPSQPLDIIAGNQLTVAFELQDLPRGVAPEFGQQEAADGVTVKEQTATASSRTFVVSVADPNTPADKVLAVTFHASAPGVSSSLDQRLELKVVPPKPWLSETLGKLGFRPASDSRLCRVGKVIYATVLERRVGGETVRLLLIPETVINDRRIRTFYIMERLVTKSQFSEFAKAEPEYELAARTADDQKWQDGPEGPVTNVYVLEAQSFARWLAGPQGSLPSTTEWELAAGYYAFRRALEARQKMPFGDVPPEVLKTDVTRMQFSQPDLGAEAWVGKGPALGEFRPAQGTSCKECSPYGLKFDFIASGMRATEMTSTLVTFTTAEADLRTLCRRGVPRGDDPDLRDGFYEARLRGYDIAQKSDEELWVKPVVRDGEVLGQAVRTAEDLNAPGVSNVLPDVGNGFDSYISFRVVILTDDPASSSAFQGIQPSETFARN